MNAIEKDVSAMLSEMELEYSCLSDHELRHADDLKLAEKRKQEDYEETEAEQMRQTAVEAEDAWEEELKAFTPASRTTASDVKNDVHSIDRKLDKKLVLIVKQKLGSSERWVMPMGARLDGESMRMAAERVLGSLCGTGLSTRFLGNAPFGFYKYKYPSSANAPNGFVGAKIFFFKAQLRGGELSRNAELSDHAWLTYEELSQYLMPAYHERVRRFLLEL
jgi:large subunit ribosomal protein L46